MEQNENNKEVQQATEYLLSQGIDPEAIKVEGMRRLKPLLQRHYENAIRTRISNLAPDSQERADGIVLLTTIDALRAAAPTPPAAPVAEEAGERERQIRQRLAAATPGPWEGVVMPKSTVLPFGTVARESGHDTARVWLLDDAVFIAAAPADLDYLLTQLAAARQQAAEATAEAEAARGDNQQLSEWMLGMDTGMSSQAIVRRYLGVPRFHYYHHPYDSGDFGRCYRVLRICNIPISCMQGASETWDRLVLRWQELERLYEAGEPASDEFHKLIAATLAPPAPAQTPPEPPQRPAGLGEEGGVGV